MNSSHHFEAHKNYIRGIDEATCRFMSELSEDKDICAFVTFTPSCHEAQNIVNYLNIVFCILIEYIDVSFTSASLILLTLVAVLMVALATLALHAVPNIITIVKYFGMSEHNSGATILVLVNGLPDIISAFFFFDGDTEMLVNEMIGTSLYLRAFQCGLLVMLYPTTLYGNYFVRDAIAYLLGILVLCSIISERDTSVFEGILAMVFYPALCFVVYIHHVAARKAKRRAEHKEISFEMETYFELTKQIETIETPVVSGENPLIVGIWRQFLIVINPLRSELYDNASKWQRILFIIGLPIAMPVKLLVPIVDLMMPGHGWSRLLLFLNFLLSPLVLLPFIQSTHFITCLGFGFSVATIFFCCTKTEIPKYNFAIAFYGLIVQMLITNILASEILSILVILGNIFGIKRPIVGTTFLAWGNTIPEIVVWCSLVRLNLKTLPLVEFLMAPLLNMIFAMGLTTVLKSINERSIVVITRPGDTGTSGIYFSVMHHMLFCFAVFATNFHLRKSLGIYSIAIYLVFVLYTYLYQFDVIHAFGTDHVDEAKFIAASWA